MWWNNDPKNELMSVYLVTSNTGCDPSRLHVHTIEHTFGETLGWLLWNHCWVSVKIFLKQVFEAIVINYWYVTQAYLHNGVFRGAAGARHPQRASILSFWHTTQWRIQDFPHWRAFNLVGGRRLPRRLRLKNFVCWNERIWTLRGCAPGTTP